MSIRTIPRVLSIAGTDPSGGAGIQADLKTIGALGGYGMSVVTTLVAQNTEGVRSIHVPPPDFLQQQLSAVSDDVTIDCVKLGMLHSVPLINTVADWLKSNNIPLVVLDPVMVATSDDRLLDKDAEHALRELCATVSLVTPNLPELAVLVGSQPASNWQQAIKQAQFLHDSTGTAVLLKGGHLSGDNLPDAVISTRGIFEVPGKRIHTTNTHGTGCSLSSAMATLGAQGYTWEQALVRSKEWLTAAIQAGASLNVGRGNGPVDHFHEHRTHNIKPEWCQKVWDDTATIRNQINESTFIQQLRAGTLDRPAFIWYLEQDALYLREYSRLMAAASSMAPTRAEQDFWAKCASSAITEEIQLHEKNISHTSHQTNKKEPITQGYLAHLRSTAWNGTYGELTAALLPCFWVYSELGETMKNSNHDDHPYADWLDTYSDPEFATSTKNAINIVERAALEANDHTRQKMAAAFIGSVHWEHAFFEAPMRATENK